MTNPFDEIKKIVQNQQDEIAKQEQAKKLLKQQEEAMRTKFANAASKLLPMLNNIVDDFGLACWGTSGYGFKKTKAYKIIPISDNWNFTAEIRVEGQKANSPRHGPYFIKIIGNKDGVITGYSLGTYHYREPRDYEEGMLIHKTEIELPPTVNESNIKEALVMIYKKQFKIE